MVEGRFELVPAGGGGGDQETVVPPADNSAQILATLRAILAELTWAHNTYCVVERTISANKTREEVRLSIPAREIYFDADQPVSIYLYTPNNEKLVLAVADLPFSFGGLPSAAAIPVVYIDTTVATTIKIISFG